MLMHQLVLACLTPSHVDLVVKIITLLVNIIILINNNLCDKYHFLYTLTLGLF